MITCLKFEWKVHLYEIVESDMDPNIPDSSLTGTFESRAFRRSLPGPSHDQRPTKCHVPFMQKPSRRHVQK